jgi:hypothetical protein
MGGTVLYEIADRAQLALGDALAATWPQATVEAWLLEAIRDYSQHFKRTRATSRTLTTAEAGQHSFDLPNDFIGMIAVEYPGDQDPPVYLERLSRRNPAFWGQAGFYDIETTSDADWDPVGDDLENPPMLWISDEVEAAKKIAFTYTATHDATITAEDQCTVPDEHQHLLIKFVVWQAMVEREAVEAQSPDTTIRMLQQFKLATQAAESAYRSALADAKKTLSGGGYTGPWKSDVYDPIY